MQASPHALQEVFGLSAFAGGGVTAVSQQPGAGGQEEGSVVDGFGAMGHWADAVQVGLPMEGWRERGRCTCAAA